MPRFLSYTTVFLVFATAVVYLTVHFLIVKYEFYQEPFAWIEGLSIWPTEALRLLAAMLCFHFIYKANYDLKKSNDEICKKFGLSKRLSPAPFLAALHRNFKRWKVYGIDCARQRVGSPAELGTHSDAAKVYAWDVWKEYGCARTTEFDCFACFSERRSISMPPGNSFNCSATLKFPPGATTLPPGIGGLPC